MTRPRVCLISPAQPACNPRLVKEADALEAAGFEVSVVSGVFGPLPPSHSAQLVATRAWRDRHHPAVVGGPRAAWNRLATRLARTMTARAGRCGSLALAMRRHSFILPLLRDRAARVDADLYIGHNIAGLVAAVECARRRGRPAGFDAEDAHHLEQHGDSPEQRAEHDAVDRIQRAFLPRCTHLTCAAPMIAADYLARYGVVMEPVLNVFPLSEAPAAPVAPPSGKPSLYWFSQKIGPGRGLEETLAILDATGLECVLELRGEVADAYRAGLAAIAGRTELRILPPAVPTEMARLAAPYHLGLAVEHPWPPHHDVCLANKAFTYLLAGVPVLLSRTRAHDALAAELGAAALLVDINDAGATGAVLRRWLSDPAGMAAAREAAWELALTRYNWDAEQRSLVASVRRAVGGAS